MVDEARQTWVPDDISLDRPNPARIYDYYLGGRHNFAADREVAERTIRVLPEAAQGAVAHRAFLRRAVKYSAARGIDQYLDIGSGLPTAGNVHELVRPLNPEARVVYVDIDPVVVAHSTAMLRDVPGTTIVEADLRKPEFILEEGSVRRLLDLERPLGLNVTAVLHYIIDDQTAHAAMRTLVDALAPGSYVAITHLSFDDGSKEVLDRAIAAYRAAANLRARRHSEIAEFFEGLELVDPGLVRPPLWHPEGPDDLFLKEPERYLGFAGVGRKP